MKVRNANNAIEVRSVLMDALAGKKSFVIWQRNDDEEVTFKVNGHLETITEKSIMKFRFEGQIPLARNVDTFFAIEDSTLIFKVDRIMINDGLIYAALPEEAKYRERRRHERKRFKSKDIKQVEINFTFKDNNPGDSVVSRVIDVSESGICFLITKETLSLIDAKEVFDVNAISNDLGFKVEKAKIMNARVYKGQSMSKGEFYALGVMFI